MTYIKSMNYWSDKAILQSFIQCGMEPETVCEEKERQNKSSNLHYARDWGATCCEQWGLIFIFFYISDDVSKASERRGQSLWVCIVYLSSVSKWIGIHWQTKCGIIPYHLGKHIFLYKYNAVLFLHWKKATDTQHCHPYVNTWDYCVRPTPIPNILECPGSPGSCISSMFELEQDQRRNDNINVCVYISFAWWKNISREDRTANHKTTTAIWKYRIPVVLSHPINSKRIGITLQPWLDLPSHTSSFPNGIWTNTENLLNCLKVGKYFVHISNVSL